MSSVVTTTTDRGQATAPPAVTEHDVRRAFALMRRIARNPYIAAKPTLKQLAFLLAEEREVLMTGSGGSGKTVGLLASALLNVDRSGYRALLVQRALAGPGSLSELAREWLEGTDASWDSNARLWRFPSGAMVCAAAWLQRSLARDTRHRRLVVIDEAWAVLRDLQIARWMASSFKLSRALGVQMIAIFHRVSDLTATGTAGSEQVELAKGLLSDSSTQVIYQQPNSELEQTRQVLRLSEAEAHEVLYLPRGDALWRVGDRRFKVRHHLSPVESWIVDTDARMREA